MTVLSKKDYRSKLLGCWTGKNIGGTAGAPFEWHRQINNIDSYPESLNLNGNPLPNDDLDIQLLWLVALEEQGINLDSKILAEYWSIFVTPHWSEYGVAKINLASGLVPPCSGFVNNPYRHSCGAFIRSEIWACISPGSPRISTKYAYEDAIIDHGGDSEGLYAEIFFAALQSVAFVENDISKLMNIAMAYIPDNCGTAKAVRCVIDAHKSGKSWFEARDLILKKYRGHTHFKLRSCISDEDFEKGFYDGQLGWDAPSNVGIVTLGLLYGENDFGKTICTCINCGEDTDCTAATAGATLGIINGVEKIPEKWKKPIKNGIKTACLNLGELGFFGDQLPTTIEELTDRVEKITTQVLLSNSLDVEISKSKTSNISEAKPRAFSPNNLYKNLNGPVHKFHFYDIAVDYVNGPLVFDGEPMKVKIKVTNKYKLPANMNFKWYLENGWSICPSQTGSFFIDTIWLNNETVLEFELSNNNIDKINNRFVIEFTIEGKSTTMLVPILLHKNSTAVIESKKTQHENLPDYG